MQPGILCHNRQRRVNHECRSQQPPANAVDLARSSLNPACPPHHRHAETPPPPPALLPPSPTRVKDRVAHASPTSSTPTMPPATTPSATVPSTPTQPPAPPASDAASSLTPRRTPPAPCKRQYRLRPW
ncbi:unnamed protein product, partial [Ectocarpus sp. 12 AP-2014]